MKAGRLNSSAEKRSIYDERKITRHNNDGSPSKWETPGVQRFRLTGLGLFLSVITLDRERCPDLAFAKLARLDIQ